MCTSHEILTGYPNHNRDKCFWKVLEKISYFSCASNCMTLISLHCAEVTLRNCPFTHFWKTHIKGPGKSWKTTFSILYVTWLLCWEGVFTYVALLPQVISQVSITLIDFNVHVCVFAA